jgi:hypothetical protein
MAGWLLRIPQLHKFIYDMNRPEGNPAHLNVPGASFAAFSPAMGFSSN